MSRHMSARRVEPPLWRGVVRFSDGRVDYLGPYNFKVGATQAINRALNDDEKYRSVIRVPKDTTEPYGPYEEFPNPHWRRGTFHYETATRWDPVE